MALKRSVHISSLTAFMVIGLAGLITFGSGLANQFVGDDFGQVVDNVPVHSLSGIPGFFAGSTFYHGPGTLHLVGVYYRPLMTTIFALLYRVVGPHAYGFHLLQLLIYIGGAYLLFLLYREFLRPGLALCLSLVFLVHPVNSQAVFSIANLQEPLYFGFGVLALWLLVHFRDRSRWFTVAAAAALTLSLLSKETGLCFVALALSYTLIFSRHRLRLVAGWSSLTLALYLVLKIPAVGLLANPGDAPIDQLSLPARLLSAPAIWVFYLAKIVFPWHIAHAYYWVVRTPGFHFWLPLALIVALGVLLVLAGRRVGRRSPRAGRVYAFFSVWLAVGLIFHSQMAPLDLTLVLSWYMMPMAGLLGLAGVLIQTFALDLTLIPRWRRVAIGLTAAIIVLMASRTAVRGLDWSGTYTLAARDLAVSDSDYPSANLLAYHAEHQGDFAAALAYAQQSVAVHATADNLDTLGVAEAGLGHCAAADRAFSRSLSLAATVYVRRHRDQLKALCVDHTAASYPRP